MYYEIWQQFDPDGTQYIRYDQLSEFLDVLEPPLQIHKPNKYKIISMDIPICRGDMMFCVDILDALTKDFFARKGNPIEETGDIEGVNQRPDEVGYEPVSSTLWRQREEYCARLIQHAWRKHKQHSDHKDGENTGDENETGDEHEGGGAAGLGSSHNEILGGEGSLSRRSSSNKSNKSNKNINISTNNLNNIKEISPLSSATGGSDEQKVGSSEKLGCETAVLVESDGFVTKNGHRVVIHSSQSRSPSTTSRMADV